jgi:hypothetical protein
VMGKYMRSGQRHATTTGTESDVWSQRRRKSGAA